MSDADATRIVDAIADDPSKGTELKSLPKQDAKDRASDRILRQTYAKVWAILAAAMLVAMNLVFIATGAGLLHYRQWVLELYVAATIGNVFGIVLVITRYLFPRRDNR